jgi:hypothetical protein
VDRTTSPATPHRECGSIVSEVGERNILERQGPRVSAEIEERRPLRDFALLAVGLGIGFLVAAGAWMTTSYDPQNPASQLTSAGCAFAAGVVIPLTWLPLSTNQKIGSSVLAVLTIVIPTAFGLIPVQAPVEASNSLEALAQTALYLVDLGANTVADAAANVAAVGSSIVLACIAAMTVLCAVGASAALVSLAKQPSRSHDR